MKNPRQKRMKAPKQGDTGIPQNAIFFVPTPPPRRQKSSSPIPIVPQYLPPLQYKKQQIPPQQQNKSKASQNTQNLQSVVNELLKGSQNTKVPNRTTSSFYRSRSVKLTPLR